MKILFLRSVDTGARPDSYSVRMDTRYADRLLGHLRGGTGWCTACGKKCLACRGRYPLDHAGDVAGIIDVPAVLEAMLDDPEEYLPATVPAYNVMVAVAVHEEVLAEAVRRFGASGRGLVVPLEDADWLTPHGKKIIMEAAAGHGMETAFPKPFCSFDPAGGLLARFKAHFKIGLPDIGYTVEDGIITGTAVRCSAPCGATYFTARGLEGKKVDEDLAYIIDNRLAAYPCTAGHAIDRDLRDSVTHHAVKIQRCVLDGLHRRQRQIRAF